MTTQANAAPFTPEQEKVLEGWTRFYPYPIMGLLEAMRQVQLWQRRISPEAEEHLARLFETTRTRVHELATFFPMFTQEPVGRARVGVCHGISCALNGAEKLCAELESKPLPEGASFERMECLGACDHAPALLLGDELCGAATPERLAAALEGRGTEPPREHVHKAEGTILTTYFDDPSFATLEGYRRRGGYEGWKKAQGMDRAALADEVKKSNLRGLGGAGFPTGMKWSTVPPEDKLPGPRYVVGNADESEPGCFKDRVLMERGPHQVLEGLLIACRAIGARHGFIFIRGEYARQHRALERAIAELEAAGLHDGITLRLMRGAGAYICGLDTALLETMEGKKAWPRQPPPFPTVAGLMGKPTVVNNVETLSMLPHIVRNGGEWFAKIGVLKSGGTGVYSISGHVERPGIYEFPMGTPLRRMIEAAGGVRGGRKLKAVIPGGASTPVLTADEVDVPMDFDSLRGVGSFLGAGGVIVLDETADMAEVAHNIERFLSHESCGQCTPCREGSEWTVRILERVLGGRGVAADLPNLERVGENITGKVICALGDTVGVVTRGMMRKFPKDFEGKIR